MLRRLPLASLVCPTTPFLAPRLLCTPTSLAGLSARCGTAPAGLQRSTYATKGTKWRMRDPKKAPRKNSQLDPSVERKKHSGNRAPVDELASLVKRFRDACDSRKAETIMDLYPTVLAAKVLNRTDTRRIAQAMHVHVRTNYFGASKTPRPFPFVDQLAEDIRAGNLEPHPFAHVHMLGIYKECKMYHQGHAFWQWLVDQDGTYVDQAVYGAAIELLAYRGEASLQQLEDLYMDGLRRFPGTFAEYHLSPEAIVPDRSQRTNIVGLPILLLQGILTARLLSRDWKQAYLALDTALRLYPTETPARFFELFMLERPISEAYTAFLLACRSGVVFRPHQLTALMAKLQKCMVASSSLQERMTILRGMVNAMYAYLECGGSLEGPHIGSFLNAFGSLIPMKQPGEEFVGDEAKLRNIIISNAHETMSTLIQAGMPPQPQLFIALISLAGKLGVPELLRVTMQDIETAQMDIGSIGRRCILASAGFLQDKSLIEDYWTQIVSLGELQSSQSSHAYWVTLAKACNAADHQIFFEQQLPNLQHTISTDAMREASHHLNMPKKSAVAMQSLTTMHPADFDSEIEPLQEQMKNIAAVIMSGQPLDLLNNPFHMSLHPEQRSLGSIDDLRVIYDELTIDPHQPPPPPAPESSPSHASVSSMGIPLKELRFQNWVTILELMNEAKSTEFEFQRHLDVAIAQKKPLREALYLPSSQGEQDPMPTRNREELRTHIRRLRAPGDSVSARPGTSISRPNRVTSLTPNAPSTPKLRYHVTEGTTPVIAPDTIKHRPLGKPKLRYHISIEPTHVAPTPASLRTSHRPLQTPATTRTSPEEDLEKLANNNKNTATE
ncbi:hypothetical protein K505DRAFT_273178 [Melanomma pulvis-pyrius CBS 109.77]|uniref:Uncharacterized protein n=1 Tax=Melanomma pulvis-pyrius CBS 109.77 TaxID=1314802 RepID=A0A6A6XG88_9PLEO|nr:hypothetical protein K505DRAFT_273178 [Melanomma pulvis-pyrius CBS 109.77]